MRLLLAAIVFVLLVTPTFMVPPKDKPTIISHEMQRSLEYVPANVTRVDDDEGYIRFGNYQIYFIAMGDGNETMLFLPGYGGTAHGVAEYIRSLGVDIPVRMFIIDAPGMGNSTGPIQSPEALIGNGTIESSYFRRYARYAYEAAIALNVTYVSGASLGGITTFLAGYFLENVTLIPIMAAGYRVYSMEKGTAINRFIRNPEAKWLIDAFDPAVFAPFIKNPTYMIVGSEDEIFDPYTFYRTYELLSVDEKAIVYLPGIGHGYHPEYIDALIALYYWLHGDKIESNKTFYIGSRHEITTDIPVSLFGLKITTYYTERGPVKSEVSEYSEPILGIIYSAIVIAALLYLYRVMGERRPYIYATTLSFLPRVFSPDRFMIFTIPAIPMFFLLASLMMTLIVVRRRLGIALSYFIRLVAGALLHIYVFPGPFMILIIVLGVLERVVNKMGEGVVSSELPRSTMMEQ